MCVVGVVRLGKSPLIIIHYPQIFNAMDADGDGYITPDEIVLVFGKIGRTLTLDNAKAIVSTHDSDKDGRISYDGKPEMDAIATT